MTSAPTPNSRLDALAEAAQQARSTTQKLHDKLTDPASERFHDVQHDIWKADLLLALARELAVSSEFFVECSINAINEAKAVQLLYSGLERRLAALEVQEEMPVNPPAPSTRVGSVSRVPLWPHEELADDEVFLGTWVDPDTRRPLDLYYRPKPKDTANGFCDAIIARWGGYKNDCRVGPADVYSLAELDDSDDVQRAMRVGHLLLVDRGLIGPPKVPRHVFGEKFQVQFCTGSNPDLEDGWVPALVDPRPSTFNTHAAADELRTLLKSRGVDEKRLRIEFIYELDDRIG